MHLDPGTIYELIDERLDPARSRAARAHLLRCERCRALGDECVAVTGALRWYAMDPPRAPSRYWDAFWRRWSGTEKHGVATGSRRSPLVPLLVAASLVGLVVGGWWTHRGPVPAPPADTPRGTMSNSVASGDSEWGEEYEFFERMTVGIGSVDPLSKGVVLVGLAERP